MTAIAQALSAALLHFIWQGTLVAFLLSIVLLLLRNRTANARYIASCAAMALMAALPGITAWMLYRQATPLPTTVAASAAISMAAAGIALQSATSAWIAMWRQWALPIWSIGVFLFALRLVLSCRHVAALRRLGNAAEGQIAETVSLLARRMKAGRAIRVLISNVAESPSVVGWLRPAILLPAATLVGLEPQQLEAILAHEIAHIRRHDYLVNLAQTLVETLLFYHPAIWWASARIRHERELCCDDAAVAACGDAISYARALSSLERLRAATPRLALGSTGGSLLYRIERLAGVRQELRPSKLPGIATLALGLACFSMTVHWAKAQQMMQQKAVPEEWGITVSSTGELLHRDRVPYPEATSKNGIQGTVTLEATLDQSGNVADARVLSGPPELRKTALQSVLQWQFANGWAGETQQVSIAFQKDARAVAQQQVNRGVAFITVQLNSEQQDLAESSLQGELRAAEERGDTQATQELRQKLSAAEKATELEGQKNRAREEQTGAAFMQDDLEFNIVKLDQQLADAKKRLSESHPEVIKLRQQIEALRKELASVSPVGSRLGRIEINGLPERARKELASQLSIQLGETLSQESINSTMAAVHAYDERLQCRFARADNGDVTLIIETR